MMNFVNFEAGEKTYKLKMSITDVINLEKKIGCNPMGIFGLDENNPQMPTVTDMVAILCHSMQKYEHGITMREAAEIFENWLEDGHQIGEFVPIIFDIFKVSGIIKGEMSNNEKN